MVVADTIIPEFLQSDADIAVDAVGAVICSKIKILTDCLHLIFKNEQFFCPCALNAVDCNTVVVKPLELVVAGSGSDAACDEKDLLGLEFFNREIDKI